MLDGSLLLDQGGLFRQEMYHALQKHWRFTAPLVKHIVVVGGYTKNPDMDEHGPWLIGCFADRCPNLEELSIYNMSIQRSFM